MLNIFIFCVLLLAVLFDLINPSFIARGYPGYNHLIHTVSELGTRESPVMNKERLNLADIGILFCLFAVGEACLFRDNTVFHILYSIGILVFGIGSVISGIYPEDPEDSEKTVSGKIHGISSGLGFMLLGLNPLWHYG